MHTINHEFSAQEIKIIEKYRDNQTNPRLKERIYAILMISKGVDFEFVSSIIGKTVKTIKSWYAIYINEGIDSLNSFQYRPKENYLNDDQIKSVIKWVTETNPSSTKIVKEYIKDQFHIDYCVEAVRTLLKKNGLRFQKPKAVPGKGPDEEEQKKRLRSILK